MAEDYAKTTRGVRVSVRSFYLADQSQPDEGNTCGPTASSIENTGRETVQLMRRTWQITDAHGRTQRVQGAGVVGEQPVLEPGESFEYTSGTPLDTPSGFMAGAYHMVATGLRREIRRGDPGVQPGQPAPERQGALSHSPGC